MLSVSARTSVANREKPADFVRGESSRLPWAWDQLCFAAPFNETSNEGFRDVVTNLAATSVNYSTWTRDDHGSAIAQLTSGNSIKYPLDVQRHQLPSTALTVYARVDRTGPASDPGGNIICMPYTTDGTEPWVSYSIHARTDDVTKLRVALYTTTSGTGPRFMSDTNTLDTTQTVSVFLRWTTGTPLQLDVLGERGNPLTRMTDITDTTGSIKYAAGHGLFLNVNETSSDYFSAYYSQVMVWARRLSDVELSTLVADPYGWYAPRRESVTVSAPFPIGPGGLGAGLQFVGPVRG